VSVSDPWLLAVLFFATAVLYSSVGNAGASGYLAAMTLAGFAPEGMKSTSVVECLFQAIVCASGNAKRCQRSRKLLVPSTTPAHLAPST
jgi:hypothetical protein